MFVSVLNIHRGVWVLVNDVIYISFHGSWLIKLQSYFLHNSVTFLRSSPVQSLKLIGIFHSFFLEVQRLRLLSDSLLGPQEGPRTFCFQYWILNTRELPPGVLAWSERSRVAWSLGSRHDQVHLVSTRETQKLLLACVGV